ncbi:MAG TPA: universal stress protein [Paludibacteraceae bacterium]|nr:universal stress protein [Paludibacteraceae bacterium]
MILALIQKIETCDNLLKSASYLAVQLKKKFGILLINNKKEELIEKEKSYLNSKMNSLQLLSQPDQIFFTTSGKELPEICEKVEALFLLIQLPDDSKKNIRFWLSQCRELRIPYVLFKDSFSSLDLSRVIVPINFLEEEIEKAQFASAFGRFCGSKIIILLANDYGSKARQTAEKMKELFDKFQLNYTLTKGNSDSYKIEKEAVQVAINEDAGIILVSASREYGLDDIVFGPKELHLVKKSPVPILLVNPRGDLYALCN